MGRGYADVMGIIIAAGVFATPVSRHGSLLTPPSPPLRTQQIRPALGSLGPWMRASITVPAASPQAFPAAVTPAPNPSLTIPGLSGSRLPDRRSRPHDVLAGVTILVSGIAMVSPIEIIQRTAVRVSSLSSPALLDGHNSSRA